MQSVLTLKNISAKDNLGKMILNKLHLSLQPGSIYMILGDSGSGKSTLVNILAGLYPYQGQIYVDSIPVEITTPKKSLKARLSILVEGDPYLTSSTIVENIFLNNYVNFYIKWRRLIAQAIPLIKAVGLDLDPAMSVNRLSKDEQILISLARAFATNPSLLVVDETIANLNRICREKFIHSLINYRSQGGSILYLGSRPDQMVYLADVIGILQDGYIKHQLTSKEIQNDPESIIRLYFLYNRPERAIHNNLNDLNDQLISAFFKSSELLASEYELQDILRFLAERACQLTQAQSCIIKLFDKESGDAFNVMKFGEIVKEETFGIREDLEKEIIESGQSVWITEKNMSMYFKGRSFPGFVCAPLKIRGKMEGIIELFFNFGDIQPDMGVIKTFANQLALAVENTRLLGRSALLQEAHHRIKNNLQSVISLLALQSEKSCSQEVEKAISQSINRIKAIAGVHELLSKDQRAISHINIRQIVQKLIDWAFVKVDSKRIKISFAGQDLLLPYKKATSLALAINELINNCIEHAFPNGRNGKIDVRMKRSGDNVIFEIIDNGIGFPEINQDKLREDGHLGLWLVQLLVTSDLAGEFNIVRSGGIKMLITFSVEETIGAI
jgi:two-component sensor histidine kinase/ABC-type branched-subunit amino acid transport system ATPase component